MHRAAALAALAALAAPLALGACWRGGDEAPPVKTAGSEPPPATALPPPAPPPLTKTRADELLDVFEELEQKICACTDAACIKQVNDEMLAWSTKMAQSAEQPKMSDADTQRAAEIARRMSDCLQNAMGMGGTTP